MRFRRPNPGSGVSCFVAFAVTAGLASVTPLNAEPWPPLPPPRPSTSTPGETTVSPPAAPQPEQATPSTSPPDSAAAVEVDECVARLKGAGYEIEVAAAPTAANQDCRIDNPVTLRAIPIAGREKKLRIAANPVVACRFAESFGGWLGTLVAPVMLGETKSELAAVHTGPGFECRNRNRLSSGKLSAHAQGLAIDIASFEMADATRIPVKPDGNDKHTKLINAVRQAACGWFTTILGPGSDASHADHLHVDLQLHGSSDRYRICQ